jgi:phosphoenolpyruvate carboxykinase (GTP)
MGAIISSETTAASIGQIGKLRHDPFAMLPFCGYHMADYFDHWLEVGEKHTREGHLPRFYYVNWFRKDPQGHWLWPGFGENIRVLKWMFERSSGKAEALETPIGFVPTEKTFDVSGLHIAPENLKELFRVDKEAWKKEVEDIQMYFDSLGHEKVPRLIWEQLEELKRRLNESKM